MTTKPNQITKPSHPRRLERTAKRMWVPIGLMRVSDIAQRDYRPWWAQELANEFDIEQVGLLTVSKRAGFFWVIDGQHRKGALELIGYGDQQIECEVYEGLSVADEAEMFLRRNHNLTVTSYSEFKVSVVAGRSEEVAIDAIVRSCGLRVGKTKGNGSTCAVGTLRRVYKRDGADSLRRALLMITGAYGDSGLEAHIIDGFGMVVHRYPDLDDKLAVTKLASVLGGINGLVTKATMLRNTTAQPAPSCVAASFVEIYNQKNRKKLPPWWATNGAAE